MAALGFIHIWTMLAPKNLRRPGFLRKYLNGSVHFYLTIPIRTNIREQRKAREQREKEIQMQTTTRISNFDDLILAGQIARGYRELFPAKPAKPRQPKMYARYNSEHPRDRKR